jgi:hypothetical protein
LLTVVSGAFSDSGDFACNPNSAQHLRRDPNNAGNELRAASR